MDFYVIESNIFSRRRRIYISMVYCQKESTTIVYGPIEFALLIKTFAKGTNSFNGFLREIKGMYEIPEIRDITIDFLRNIYHNVVWFDAKNL